MKGNIVHAVCFNMLDVAMLWKAFQDPEPDLSHLGVSTMEWVFYPEQVSFAMNIIKLIAPHQVPTNHNFVLSSAEKLYYRRYLAHNHCLKI